MEDIFVGKVIRSLFYFVTGAYARIPTPTHWFCAGEDFQILHNEYCAENCKLFTDDGKREMDSSEMEKRSKDRFNVFRAYSVQMTNYVENELKRFLGSNYEIREFLQEVEYEFYRSFVYFNK